MDRLQDIICLIPDEDDYLIDTLLEYSFGTLATKYIKNFIRGDRKKFETIYELSEFLKDPCVKLVSDNPTPLDELYLSYPNEVTHFLYQNAYGESSEGFN